MQRDSTVLEVILNQAANRSSGSQIFLSCGHIVGGKQHPEQLFDSDPVLHMEQGRDLTVFEEFRGSVF